MNNYQYLEPQQEYVDQFHPGNESSWQYPSTNSNYSMENSYHYPSYNYRHTDIWTGQPISNQNERFIGPIGGFGLGLGLGLLVSPRPTWGWGWGGSWGWGGFPPYAVRPPFWGPRPFYY